MSWRPVYAATNYQIQVDDDPSFSSPEFTSTTVNSRAVPTKTLNPGQNFWRVRATRGTSVSGWRGGVFTVSPVGVPTPQAPANGAILQQPGNPPLLQWATSQGATSYVVELDGDPDFVGASSYTTKTTSLVVPDPLPAGDYYWRVKADKGSGLVSLPSPARSFQILPLETPQILTPANDLNALVEDVVLGWTAVNGAKSYDLEVALDATFNNLAHEVKGTVGTRYSPPVTLNSDQFYWRVRAVDQGGTPTPWAISQFGFKRQWLDRPDAVFPNGTPGSPTVETTDRPFFEWTPAQHASYYELVTASDQFFSNNVDVCYTAGTTYAPRESKDCGWLTGTTTYWKVRAVDSPYPTSWTGAPKKGLPGVFSDTHAFTWSPPAPSNATFEPTVLVTGQKLNVNGSGVANAAKGCADENCDALPTTPVFSWDPVPGATQYQVYLAQDINFTTSVLAPKLPSTSNTMLSLETPAIDKLMTLPESQAGSAYYWFVRACGLNNIGNLVCGPSPVGSASPLPGTRSFQKFSPAVAAPTVSRPNSSEITFSWQDYHDTNQATVWRGEQANQSAQLYRVQVDTEPSFSTPIDDIEVDQSTYTAFKKLYPEGKLYWRVQALDVQDQGLTWSEPQSVVKTSSPIPLISPANGASMSGTAPLRWTAQPFAATYTVEVYRNGDTTFSTANRVFTQTVKTPAYAWTEPIPASSQRYVWRVRRTDPSKNVGPWSQTGSFYSRGAAPVLTGPGNGQWQPTAGPLFTWTEVAGAASYKLEYKPTSSTSWRAVSTVASAHAPTTAFDTGSYAWRVTALDAKKQVLGVSTQSSFRVDATSPTVKKISPKVLKPKSTLKVKFTEKVWGVSGKSIKLYKMVSPTKKKKVKAKVKLNSKRRVATIDPKGKLSKKHKYVLVFKLAKIKDRAGNTMVVNGVVSPYTPRGLPGNYRIVMR